MAWAWISPVPLLVALRGSPLPTSLLCGFITGSVCTALCAWGITEYSIPVYLAGVAGLGGLVAAAAWLVAWLGRGREVQWTWVLIPPVVWTALASIRSWMDLPLPSSVAGSQADFPALVQAASIAGPAGVSFLFVLGTAVIAHAMSLMAAVMRRQPVPRAMWRGLALATAALMSGVLAGVARLAQAPPPAPRTVKVAVVQGGLPIEYYRRGGTDQAARQLLRDRYVELTNFAGTSKPELIIWPEEPTLGDWLVGDRLDPALTSLAIKHRAGLLIGSSTSGFGFSPKGQRFNSALLISSVGELLGRYDKRRPTPFEPYRPGQRSPLLKSPHGMLGLLICEESFYPSLPRDLVREGAEVLVELSNDAGFGRSRIALFHAREAVLTAAAFHRPYIRAGQSGPSYLIDPLGRIDSRSGLFDSSVLVGLVAPSAARTPYLRWGEWLPVLCLILGVGFALVSHRVSPARPSSMRDR